MASLTALKEEEDRARAFILSQYPQDFRDRHEFRAEELIPFDEKVADLSNKLADANDMDAKVKLLADFLDTSLLPVDDPQADGEGEEDDGQSSSSSGESDRTVKGENCIDIFELASKHNLSWVVDDWFIQQTLLVTDGPLERPPCANIQLERDQPSCEKDAELLCDKCRLVSYCSKECQEEHWREWHKDFCKKFSEWLPSWVIQDRRPTFLTKSTARSKPEGAKSSKSYLPLWGGPPAIDTLNLIKNEGISPVPLNLALAYVASGGLRNVVRTLNGLPSDFSGEVTLLLNEREPIIAIRNLVILLLLTRIEDGERAADVALHFWASASLQHGLETIHSRMLRTIIQSVQEDGSFSLNLGGNLRISGIFSKVAVKLLRQMYDFRVPYIHASDERERVMFDKNQNDRLHRIYCRMKPSHREALEQFRITGVLLPNGGGLHFTEPNKFLYSLEGRWLQDELATPLDEWNVEDVIAGGMAHGIESADIYGCLYFYLSDQLRTFAARLREFKISMKLFTEDPRVLAHNLGEGLYEPLGLPKGFGFDRIDVSNVAESRKAGLSHLLVDWAPFLNKNNPKSTILGHFSSWFANQRKSTPSVAEIQVLMVDLLEKGRLDGQNMHPDLISVWVKYFVALHDNYPAFEEYLERKGVDEAALKVGLIRKAEHTIVPHRIGARLDDPPNALPYFPTEDSWYWNVQVGQTSLHERYVEFANAQ